MHKDQSSSLSSFRALSVIIVRQPKFAMQIIITNLSTLQGDSGSSLQYSVERGRWVQVGVVSFGAATGCDNEHPNGYSKIAHYLDWIGNVTGVHYD